MFTRTAFLALAAAALFGVTAALPTTASAFNGRGVSHGGSHVSIPSRMAVRTTHFTPNKISHSSKISHLGFGHGSHVGKLGGHTHPGFKWSKHNKWTKNHCCKWGKCGKFKWAWWYRHHHRFYFARWHHFRYMTPLYATYAARPVVSYSAPVPVASNCNCLTKRYEDGAVIFEDVCTKESAISPPQDQALAEPPSQ